MAAPLSQIGQRRGRGEQDRSGRVEAGWQMGGELHTVAETAQILKVRESWLKTKASARLVPCTFVGKHLRFSDDDIAEIMRVGAREPVTRRRRSMSSGT